MLAYQQYTGCVADRGPERREGPLGSKTVLQAFYLASLGIREKSKEAFYLASLGIREKSIVFG